MKTFYEKLGAKVGRLVDGKNEAYGSSFARSGDFLRLLFPEGVSPERYGDALLLARIFDKQMRIASDRDAFGESPYQDIAGYGLLGLQLHQERNEHECASARQDVAEGSMGPNASAASDASKPTTANAAQPPAMPSVQPSIPPCESTSAPTDALAPDATANASREEAVRVGRRLNESLRCARCANLWPDDCWGVYTNLVRVLVFCSKMCAQLWIDGDHA